MSINQVGFHPGARLTDPETSHEANDAKDHRRSQAQILQDVKVNGPGSEETILNRMGVPQRSSASSEISSLVRNGHLVELIDPRDKKVIKLRNTSGCRARVRGLPAHQKDGTLIQKLVVQMDTELDEQRAARKKPPMSTVDVGKASAERRKRERRQRNRRKSN
jgi:hypothetical protein